MSVLMKWLYKYETNYNIKVLTLNINHLLYHVLIMLQLLFEWNQECN